MPKLTLLLDGRVMQAYDFNQPSIIVGRDDGADVRIEDRSVSRRHAEIRLGEEGSVVEDLGSSNGTFLRGQRMEGPQSIRLGDEIGFGKFSIVFGKALGEVKVPDSAPPPKADPSPDTRPVQKPEVPVPAPSPIADKSADTRTMQKSKIFFSYSRDDGEFVLKLAQDLREAGVSLWLDQLDIAGGQRWDQAIEEALQSCQTQIVVLSPSAVASHNVMDEVSFALEEGKQVIPVLCQECEVPFRLRRVQRIDFTGGYDQGFQRLLATLAIEGESQSSGGAKPRARGGEHHGTPRQSAATEPAPVEESIVPTEAAAPRTKRRARPWLGLGVVVAAGLAAFVLLQDRRDEIPVTPTDGSGPGVTQAPADIPAAPQGVPVSGWLGIMLAEISPEDAQSMPQYNAGDVVVAHATDGGPAQAAGVLSGDIVTHIAGEPIADVRQATEKMSNFAPGTEIQLGLIRDGRDITLPATASQRPDVSVPDVANAAVNDALKMLVAAGFPVEMVEEPSSGAPGRVLRSDPPAGTTLTAGETVTLVVSVGGSEPDVVSAPVEVSLVESLTINSGWVPRVAFSPDGTRIAGGRRSKVILWDTRTGEQSLAIDQASHGDMVLAVAFSPDGSRIVSGSRDTGEIVVSDTRTGSTLLTVPVLGNKLHCDSVAFSPDGTRIMAGCWNSRGGGGHSLQVWDARTGDQVFAAEGSGGPVAFSPDSKWFLSGSNLQLWDTHTGDKLLTFDLGDDHPDSVVFSPNGSRIAAGGRNGTIKVWDTRTGEEQLTIQAHNSVSVAFSPDGDWIVSGTTTDGSSKKAPEEISLTLWNAHTGDILHSIQREVLCPTSTKACGVQSVAVSPDGSRIVSAIDNWSGEDRTMKVWDVRVRDGRDNIAPESPAQRPDVSVPDVANATVEAAIEMLAAAGFPAEMVEEPTSGTRGRVLRSDPPAGTPLTAGETVTLVVAVGGSEPDVVRAPVEVSLVETGTIEASLTDVAVSPDGSRVAGASWGKQVILWDTETGEQSLVIDQSSHGDLVLAVAFSPDGNRIVSGSRDTRALVVSDTRKGSTLLTLPVPGDKLYCHSVDFSPDGTRIIAGCFDGYDGGGHSLQLWDASTGEEVFTAKGYGGPVAFSPDSKWFVSHPGYSPLLQLWDTRTGDKLLTFDLGGSSRGEPGSVAFSRDGSRIAAGGSNGTIKVWDTRTGEERLTLQAHNRVNVAFSPNGDWIVSGTTTDGASNEKPEEISLTLWNAHTGDKLHSIQRDALCPETEYCGVQSVAVSPDGNGIVAALANRTMKVWDVRPR